MKKVVLVLSCVFVFMLSGTAYAMSYQEFIQTYPNEYIYKVCFPNGWVYYFSSPDEIEFSVDDWDGYLQVGKALSIGNPTRATIIFMKNDGSIQSFNWGRHRVVVDSENWIGFTGDIDIYEWNGYGFFLPLPLLLRQSLESLGGPIHRTLPIGFGIMSGVLLVKLLTGYFRSYLNRSL